MLDEDPDLANGITITQAVINAAAALSGDFLGANAASTSDPMMKASTAPASRNDPWVLSGDDCGCLVPSETDGVQELLTLCKNFQASTT